MDKDLEKKIREIYQEIFDENYNSGTPRIPPHTHNGVDNLPVVSSGGNGTPSGNNTEIQFNNNGTFGADPGLTYDPNTQFLAFINATNVVGNDMTILTDFADSTIATHNILIKSGNSDTHTSGDLNIISGDAQFFNNVGDINIVTGNDTNASGQRGGNVSIQGGSVIIGSNADNQGVTINANNPGASFFVSASDATGFIGLSSGGNVLISSIAGPVSFNFNSGQATIDLTTDVGGSNGAVNIHANDQILLETNLNAGRLHINAIGIPVTGNLGTQTIFIDNCTNAPTGNPTTGGVLYVEGGALKYRGSGGTTTTIANA